MVLILTDQLRYDCIGVNGSQVQTPNLDVFASEGIRFERAFTPCGICSPARASILTSRYPQQHRIMNNVTGPDAVAKDLPPDMAVLPRLLADAGYRTAHVGKYHVADHEDPTRNGFTDAAGPWRFGHDPEFQHWRAERGHPFDPADMSSWAPISAWTTPRPLTPEGSRRVEQHGFPVMGREEVPLEATHAAYLVDRALGFIDEYQRGEQPFFLVLSFLGPHWPHLLPEPYWSMYDPGDIDPWPNFGDTLEDKPGSHRACITQHGVEGWTWEQWQPVVATYFGSVTFHDELIGRFLSGLSGRGLDDDTLVAITTDHGDMTGSHGQFNKGPYGYEELYRIPFFMRWPGHVAPGARSGVFASLLDLMPTFLSAARVPSPQPVDGRDLTPVLHGDPGDAWPDHFVAEYSGNEFGLCSTRILRTPLYKYVYNAHDIDELYDLDNDPYELVNLAGDTGSAALVRELQSLLWAWMDDHDDPLAGPAAAFLA